MTARRIGLRFGIIVSSCLSFCLAACAGPVALYHDAEGGAIAQPRQAPPGENKPYPNLADVPPAYSPAAADEQAAIAAQARLSGPGVSPANQDALAGLALPTAAPPLPPGIAIPTAQAAPALPPPPPPKPPAPRLGVAVPLGFAPAKAVLPVADQAALAAIAARRGNARVIAGGFGDDGSLPLAIARAQRVAAALTALGVPPQAIHIVATAQGSGGFVQLVY